MAYIFEDVVYEDQSEWRSYARWRTYVGAILCQLDEIRIYSREMLLRELADLGVGDEDTARRILQLNEKERLALWRQIRADGGRQ